MGGREEGVGGKGWGVERRYLEGELDIVGGTAVRVGFLERLEDGCFLRVLV